MKKAEKYFPKRPAPNCKYVTFLGKRDFADAIKVKDSELG